MNRRHFILRPSFILNPVCSNRARSSRFADSHRRRLRLGICDTRWRKSGPMRLTLVRALSARVRFLADTSAACSRRRDLGAPGNAGTRARVVQQQESRIHFLRNGVRHDVK